MKEKRREDESRGQSNVIAGFEDRRGHEPGNAVSLWKLDEAREWNLY